MGQNHILQNRNTHNTYSAAPKSLEISVDKAGSSSNVVDFRDNGRTQPWFYFELCNCTDASICRRTEADGLSA